MSTLIQSGYEGAAQPLSFTYVNHDGKEGIRNVIPLSIFFGVSKYYTDPQWLMEAWDQDKQAIRHYALSKINKELK